MVCLREYTLAHMAVNRICQKAINQRKRSLQKEAHYKITHKWVVKEKELMSAAVKTANK